jgi:hypothetical protein
MKNHFEGKHFCRDNEMRWWMQTVSPYVFKGNECVVYRWERRLTRFCDYVERPLFFAILDMYVKVTNTRVTHLWVVLTEVLCMNHSDVQGSVISMQLQSLIMIDCHLCPILISLPWVKLPLQVISFYFSFEEVIVISITLFCMILHLQKWLCLGSDAYLFDIR